METAARRWADQQWLNYSISYQLYDFNFCREFHVEVSSLASCRPKIYQMMQFLLPSSSAACVSSVSSLSNIYTIGPHLALNHVYQVLIFKETQEATEDL